MWGVINVLRPPAKTSSGTLSTSVERVFGQAPLGHAKAAKAFGPAAST